MAGEGEGGGEGGARKEHPYDGIRPRHACCPACGYVFGGIEIVRSRIRCPECGETFVFEIPGPRAGGGGGKRAGVSVRWKGYATGGLVVGVLIGWEIGTWAGLGVALLGSAVAAGVMALIAWAWNRVLAE